MPYKWRDIPRPTLQACVIAILFAVTLIIFHHGTTPDTRVFGNSNTWQVPSERTAPERFHATHELNTDHASETPAAQPPQLNISHEVAHKEYKGGIDRQLDDSQCGQKSRQRQLQQTCEWAKSRGLVDGRVERLQSKYTNRLIFVDDVHKVLYCEIPKVACTSWKVFFANISGKVDPKDYPRLHQLVHDTTYYPKVGFKYLKDFTYEERLYRLKHYFKFLVVRNPFAKLISAYENKFALRTHYNLWYHQNVGTHIIKRYRNQPSKEALEKGDDVRFEEFVRFVTDEANDIKYKYDPHWWPVQDTCYPCMMQYDYIAKLETFQEDLGYITEQIVPDQSSHFPYLNSNSQEVAAKLSAYYKNVSVSVMNKIRNLYHLDHEMFGYSLNDNEMECQK